MPAQPNRKLLVSVFDAQEAREAVIGGARIVDAEDPASALGNIKPRQIMAISDAVLDYKRGFDVMLSTNIGEDQLLFDRSEDGRAIRKSPYEMAGKAAQAAIGVACAMGTKVHDTSFVKVGLDGMSLPLFKEVLQEVVLTMKNTVEFNHARVMSVLFVQDMDLWEERRKDWRTIETLIAIREYHAQNDGDVDLLDYAEYFRKKEKIEVATLEDLKKHGLLPEDATNSKVVLNTLFSHARTGLAGNGNRRTNKAVIKAMVDATADAGAHAIMLDTQIQTKECRISLLDLSEERNGKVEGLYDFAQFDNDGGKKLTRVGILSLEEVRFFVDYCHARGIEANLAGSLQSYHAQQIWYLVPEADQVSTRGGSSGIRRNLADDGADGADTRVARVTKRSLVRGLIAPEDGGCLNLPEGMGDEAGAMARQLSNTYGIEAFWVDPYGEQKAI